MIKLHNFRIAARLAMLGGLLLAATAVVGIGGWRGLSQLHALERRSAQESAAYAQAMDTARVAQVDFKKQVQEWKDLLLRGMDAEAFAKYRQAFETEGGTVTADLERLKTQMQALGSPTAGVDKAIATQAELRTRYLAALVHFDAHNLVSAHVVDNEVKGIDRAPTDAVDGLVASMMKDMSAASARIDAASLAAYRTASVLLLSVLIGALLSGMVITWALARSITRPIRHAVHVAQAVAAGDLGKAIDVHGRDETAQLLGALHEMNGQLRRVVRMIRDGSLEISSATREIASGNMDLSSRTNEQAAALEETAASMQQFSEGSAANAAGAREASSLAQGASSSAHQANLAMRDAVGMMDQVGDVSRRIAEITTTIDAIAMQTHILSLNASVEAARAGQGSQGFNVVAAEVRTLATHSKQAAGDIRRLIDEAATIIEQSRSIIQDAGGRVHALQGDVGKVATTVSDIARQSGEQSLGVQQVNQAVRQLDEVTQSNAALVEQAAAAADAVQVRARALVDSVAFFRLGEAA